MSGTNAATIVTPSATTVTPSATVTPPANPQDSNAADANAATNAKQPDPNLSGTNATTATNATTTTADANATTTTADAEAKRLADAAEEAAKAKAKADADAIRLAEAKVKVKEEEEVLKYTADKKLNIDKSIYKKPDLINSIKQTEKSYSHLDIHIDSIIKIYISFSKLSDEIIDIINKSILELVKQNIQIIDKLFSGKNKDYYEPTSSILSILSSDKIKMLIRFTDDYIKEEKKQISGYQKNTFVEYIKICLKHYKIFHEAIKKFQNNVNILNNLYIKLKQIYDKINNFNTQSKPEDITEIKKKIDTEYNSFLLEFKKFITLVDEYNSEIISMTKNFINELSGITLDTQYSTEHSTLLYKLSIFFLENIKYNTDGSIKSIAIYNKIIYKDDVNKILYDNNNNKKPLEYDNYSKIYDEKIMPKYIKDNYNTQYNEYLTNRKSLYNTTINSSLPKPSLIYTQPSAPLIIPLADKNIGELVNIAYSMCMANTKTIPVNILEYHTHPINSITYKQLKLIDSNETQKLIYPFFKIKYDFNLSDILFLKNNKSETENFNYAYHLGRHMIDTYKKKKLSVKVSAPVPSDTVIFPLVNDTVITLDNYEYNVMIYIRTDAFGIVADVGNKKMTTNFVKNTYFINILQDNNSYHLLPILEPVSDIVTQGGKSMKVSYKKLYHMNKKMLKKLKNI